MGSQSDVNRQNTTIDSNTHHVNPHVVDGYYRSDGTYVEEYRRGGEDGYERSNPDDDITNNLNYDESQSGNTDSNSFSYSASSGR